MFFITTLNFICLIYTTHADVQNLDNIDIAAEFIKAGIVPKVIPHAPTKLLNVIITKGDLIPGTIVYYEDDEHQPSVDYEAEKGSWHTLIISAVQNWDPDEKICSRTPKITFARPFPQDQWIIWILTNIRGNDALRAIEYYKCKSPIMEGDEQIVNLELYLLYKQPGELYFKDPFQKTRKNNVVLRSVPEFTEKYNMTGPVAGNFLYRRWAKDPSVVHDRYY